jgi:hypothetical protein
LGPAIRPGDVDDPADAICALLWVKRGGVFHLGSGPIKSVARAMAD